MNDIGHLFFRPSPPYGDCDIRSSDKKLWGLTPPYPYLIVTNENFCLNLEKYKLGQISQQWHILHLPSSQPSLIANYLIKNQ